MDSGAPSPTAVLPEGFVLRSPERRDPTLAYLTFLALAALIAALYWHTAAVERAPLDIEGALALLERACGDAAAASAAGDDDDYGKGGGGGDSAAAAAATPAIQQEQHSLEHRCAAVGSPTRLPGRRFVVLLSLVAAGPDASIPASLERHLVDEIIASQVRSAIEAGSRGSAIIGENTPLEVVAQSFDRWDPDLASKTALQAAAAASAATPPSPPVGAPRRDTRSAAHAAIHAVTAALPDNLDALVDMGWSPLRIALVLGEGPGALTTACARDTNDRMRGGCIALAANVSAAVEESAANRAILGHAVASVLAQLLETPSFRGADVETWLWARRRAACCSVWSSMQTLQRLMSDVSGMPVPPAVLHLHKTVQDSLRHATSNAAARTGGGSTNVQPPRLVRAAHAADQLVNSVMLTPQLVLPWDQHLALHLPFVLPVAMTVLTGAIHVLRFRRQERARKAAA